jgi:hypothetical protein
MKYLCLIYDDEQQMMKRPRDETGKMSADYMTYTEGIKKSGHYLGGNALQPTHTATTVRSRGGRSPPPTVRSRRPKSSSAATT